MRYFRQFQANTIFMAKILKDLCAEVNGIPSFMAFDSEYKNRIRATVIARQMFCRILYDYSLKNEVRLSLNDIGTLAFYPDLSCALNHATVLHSIKTITNLAETDKMIRRNYDEAKDRFLLTMKVSKHTDKINISNVEHGIKLASFKDQRFKTNKNYIVT